MNMKKAVLFALALTVLTGCSKNDMYDPNLLHDTPLASEQYFNFKTTQETNLSVNFGMSGSKIAFSVYSENPIDSAYNEETYTLKGIEPLLRAYTDDDSKYTGKLHLPSYLNKVYVYTSVLGHYSVQEVSLTSSGFVLDNTATTRSLSTRSVTDPYTIGIEGAANTDANPYNMSDKLGKWNNAGLSAAIAVDATAATTDAALVIRLNQKIASDNNATSTTNAMLKYDNSRYAKGKAYTNITTAQPLLWNDRTQQMEGGTKIELHFLWEWAGFHNVLGYYYYPKNNPPTTEAAFKAIPKYVVFPSCTWNEKLAGNTNPIRQDLTGIPLQRGSYAKLMYYGENYDQAASADFPKDVTIGWFFVSDAFNTADQTINGKTFQAGSINGYLLSNTYGKKKHYATNATSVTSYNAKQTSQYNMPYIFSNEEYNKNSTNGCISLYDNTSGHVVMGFEDGDLSTYCDCLFYVKTNPGVINPGWDEIPNPEFKSLTTTYKGVVAFEDLWPSKGDYDMNDVVVNYESTITTDANNNIQNIVDKFTTVHSGADYINGFGYELGIPKDKIKSIVIDRQGLTSSFLTDSKGLEPSEVTKSVIMLYDNHKQALNKTLTVTTTLTDGIAYKTNYMSYQPPYNPFIIAQSDKNKGEGRLEIHLPKTFPPTSLAGKLGTEDDMSTTDCWYVSNPDKTDGIQYPFAITIPFTGTYNSFIPPTERVKISTFYSDFSNWVKTSGAQNADWYKVTP